MIQDGLNITMNKKNVDAIENYVVIYGEFYRKLIEDSLKWLDVKEKEWNLEINRDLFIKDLIDRTVKNYEEK
jgi:hypothetical protein